MDSTTLHTLITGASSGIGQSIAVRLSQEGRSLLLNGRELSRLEATMKLCSGNHHEAWVQDLGDVGNVQKSLESCIAERQIKVDGFVHSAGMASILAIRAVDLAGCSQILNVNAVSAILITASLSKQRVAKNSLRNIIFISSLFSRFGAKGHGLYAASKGALDAFMRCAALDLAPTVRVNSICPGGVKTRMASIAFQDEVIRENLMRTYPLGIGHPQDVAEIVNFLLSDKSKWITGQQFFVDGGRSINMSHK